MSVLAGAGGLRSTTRDMLTFLAANLQTTQTPLADIMAMFHVKHCAISPSKNGLVRFVVVLCNYSINFKDMFVDRIGEDILQLLLKER